MKRAQVSIFIVTGVIVIAAILIFLTIRTGLIPEIFEGKEVNPTPFLDSCIKDKVTEAVKIISAQGGYVENKLNRTFKFEGEASQDISYLCYNQNYYLPCVNQESMLIQHLKSEIKNYIADDVENCFNGLVKNLEEENFEVQKKYRDFEVEFVPGKIILNIDGELILTKSRETSHQENFKVVVLTKFYDLAIVVQEIVNQEAQFCHFEHLGFMLAYSQFNLDRFRTGDLDTIYTLEYRDTKEKFRFAVRSCVIPPGI